MKINPLIIAFATIILSLLIFISLFGLSLTANMAHGYIPDHAGYNDDINDFGYIDCFVVGSHCATPLQHVNNWQQAFSAIAVIAFVFALIIFTAGIFFRPKLYDLSRQVKIISKNPFGNPIFLGLSSGTLQPIL